MKSILVSMLAFGLMTFTVLAEGGGFGVFGSFWSPKDFDDDLLGGGAKLQFNASPNVSVELRGSGLVTDHENEGFKTKFTVVPIELNLLFNLMPYEPVNPYVGVGAGYYIFDFKVKGAGYSETLNVDNEFGVFGVGGLELKVGVGARIFAEIKYTNLEIKSVEGLPADISMNGVGVNAGLILDW